MGLHSTGALWPRALCGLLLSTDVFEERVSDPDSQKSQPRDVATPDEADRTAPSEPGSEPTAHKEPASADRQAWLQAGDTVAGRFVIIRFVARGGMGEVYEADDTALRTRVALKTLRPEFAADTGSLERFRREVLLARSVAHPNVCRVFELHSTVAHGGPLTFLTMEYLEGDSLAAFLTRTGPLDPGEALPLVRQMAAALDAAHAHGVVHRDFKPSNVVLVPQRRPGAGLNELRVVVTDFGIARALSSSREAFATTGGTGTEGFLGTPDYVAPEQVSQEAEIGPSTDLYSFGVVLYQMMTGELPFHADTPMGAILRRLKERPKPPERVRRGLDRRWSDAILHCLELDPQKRPASAAQVLDELAREPQRSRPRRRILLLWIASGLTALVLAGLVVRHAYSGKVIGGAPPRRTMAVLSLATQVPPGEGWRGPALSRLLAAEFEETKGLRVLPWWRVAGLYSSLGVDADQVLDDAKRPRVYELLPADDFVEGTLQCPTEAGADTCRLQVEVRRADRSIRAKVERTFLRSEPALAVGDVGSKIRELLGASLDQSLEQGLAARRSRLEGISKPLGEAVAAYTRHDVTRSRQFLELATSLAPSDFDAQDALSRVLERQGLFVAARRAAERAAGAARPLSADLQRSAVARVDFLGDDPGRAVAAYRALLEKTPEDTDVVLALSRRLPGPEALDLVKRTRALPGGPSRDLLLAIEEAQLESKRQVARAPTIPNATRDTAERLKARRELSLISELDGWGSLGRAEALALEMGDRQRAAYLHLLRAGGSGNELAQRMHAESLATFRVLGDRVGAHHVLVRSALARRWEDVTQNDWDASSRVLAEAAAELTPTEEPPSSEYHLATAEVELHRGNLPAARKALEAAHLRLSQPSLDLLIDVPHFETLPKPSRLEFELLVQEDRLDEAEAFAKDRLRRNQWNEGYLCQVQCERGLSEEANRCFRQLLGADYRGNQWGPVAARCAWEGHDLDEAEHAAYQAQDPEVIAALLVVEKRYSWGYSGQGHKELEGMIAAAGRQHDLLKELQLQLLLGSAELSAWSTLDHGPLVEAQLRRSRRRLQSVQTEARRRGFALIARKAAVELKRDSFSPSARTP
ncbi:MAG TPA: protein kinase [Myxococcaceae bacterium]|nr:protein kinase [Myxococcaceae bacterium]